MDNETRVGFWRRLARATIWHPAAIPADAEWKYRWEKRLWLPLYDAVMIAAGLWAALWGSPTLHALFDETTVDVSGGLLAIAAAVCLCGVVFPRLWLAEILGKLFLVFLLATYAAAVAFFRGDPAPEGGFVVFILAGALYAPCSRLTTLAEEYKQRRAEKGA